MERHVTAFEATLDRLSGRLAYRRYQWTFLAILLLIATAVCSFFLTADIDLFTRVAVGRLVHLDHAVPDRDPFVFTPAKARWHDHEWLAGVLFYGVSQLAGDAGLFMLKLLFLAATLLVIRKAQDGLQGFRGESLELAFLILPHLLNIWLPTVRAQSFTYLFYSLFLLAFVRFRKRASSPLFLALPFLMAVWVNAHGGFVVGLAFVGCFALCALIESPRKAWIAAPVAGLCAAATLVNPYGFSFLRFIFQAVTNPPVIIDEWAPVGIFSGHSLLMLFFVAALIAGTLQRERLPLEAYPILLITLVESALHKRFVPFFSIAAAVYLPAHAGALFRLLERCPGGWFRKLRRSLVLLILILALGSLLRIAFYFPMHGPFSLSYERYPVEALEWLREQRPGGNVLLHYNEGSYALWRLFPKFKISLDGRYDGVFPMETIELVLGALDGTSPRQHEYFERIDPDYILLAAPSLEFESRASLFPGYSAAYQDGKFAILEKGDGSKSEAPAGHSRRYIWDPLF